MKKTNPYVLIFALFLCLVLLCTGCDSNNALPEPDKKNAETVSQSPAKSGTEPSNTPPAAESPSGTPGNPAPNGNEKNTPIDDAQAAFQKLAPTTVMSFAELVGDNGDYADASGYPPAGTYKLVVNIRYQIITAFTKDKKGEYTVPVRYMVCSTGASATPTPTGTFKMGNQRHRFSKFETYDVYGQYWSQITRNIFFHTLLYTSRNAKTYTRSSYRNLGKRASHGCIRMLVPDARWIYYYAAPGTVVEIVAGKKDAAMEEIKKKLVRAKLPSQRPDLEKGKIPVTEAWPGYSGSVTKPAENQQF